MVKVSIVVPIYNTEKYLKNCIESLLGQTLKDIEIILINDGSPGNASEIVKSYNDKRIVYIEKENEGIGATRNLGIEKASGEYLMFIDSDDYIAPDCAEKMYNRAKEDDLDLVISDYYEDRNGVIKEIKYDTFEDCSLEDHSGLINHINLGPCNKIYKKTIFDDESIRFEEKLKYEDVPFVLKAMVKAKRIGKIDECLSYYVIHDDSQTTVRDAHIFDILDICQIIIKSLNGYDYLKKPLVEVIVMILTDYTIQQRYIADKQSRTKFIDEAFKMLDSLDGSWRKCEYLKRFNLLKRTIKSHANLTKLYCSVYNWKTNFISKK